MESLSYLAEKMVSLTDVEVRCEAEKQFIEILTFSKPNDIVAMLDDMLKNHWIDFPVWARNLSFRLACLLEPNNIEFLRRAAVDLRSFGPDWDTEADRLDEKADKLENMIS